MANVNFGAYAGYATDGNIFVSCNLGGSVPAEILYTEDITNVSNNYWNLITLSSLGNLSYSNFTVQYLNGYFIIIASYSYDDLISIIYTKTPKVESSWIKKDIDTNISNFYSSGGFSPKIKYLNGEYVIMVDVAQSQVYVYHSTTLEGTFAKNIVNISDAYPVIDFDYYGGYYWIASKGEVISNKSNVKISKSTSVGSGYSTYNNNIFSEINFTQSQFYPYFVHKNGKLFLFFYTNSAALKTKIGYSFSGTGSNITVKLYTVDYDQSQRYEPYSGGIISYPNDDNFAYVAIRTSNSYSVLYIYNSDIDEFTKAIEMNGGTQYSISNIEHTIIDGKAYMQWGYSNSQRIGVFDLGYLLPTISGEGVYYFIRATLT